MSEIKEIEIKESVLGHLLYFFIFISKKFQGSLSQIFWWVFIKPFLLIGKLLERTTQKEHQRLNDKTYLVLDNFNRSHRIYFKYLKFVFEVNRIISGVSTQDKVYKKLVNWNKSIPLMGFRHDRTTYNIMMLKDKYKDGREIGEHISLGSNNYHGKFKILLKNSQEYRTGERQMAFDCIWISGDDAGKIFRAERFFPHTIDKGSVNDNICYAVYFPPIAIIVIFELLVSASAIIAFLELTKNGWKYLFDLILKLIQWLVTVVQNL